MISGESFTKYVNILASDDDTYACAKAAIAELWEDYHIARMELMFQVAKTPLTPDGFEIKSYFDLDGKDIDETTEYRKSYTTGEGGLVELAFYMGSGYTPWTEEEKKDLEAMLNVMFFHCGRYRLIQVVEQSVLTDASTGMLNSQGYLKQASALFKKHDATEYNSYYINLKRFSLVNKKFGTGEADAILRRYAVRLREFANEDECVGRLGGDNFVALIKRERTEEFLQFLAGVKLYGKIGERESAIVVSAVAGIWEIDDQLHACDQMISKSGIAMNIAKNVTKQPYLYVSKELDERVENEKKILNDFSKALKNKEFQVYYQPKVETDTYTIVGAEALVRWYKKDVLISPKDFIPVIERDGSICNLDFYMLECVCEDIARWLTQGIEPVRVSVNFSRKHLSNPEFANKIIQVLQKYHVDNRYIEVEVTETMDEEEQGLLALFMEKMREHQITVSIDDFGTGYSSLNVLRTFPVEVLKIDKSFIDNNQTENDTIVLSNIIHMAKQMNMDVVSEGVENWEQVELLHDMECNIVQGFLFDKPMPKEAFEQKMVKKQYDITQILDYEG